MRNRIFALALLAIVSALPAAHGEEKDPGTPVDFSWGVKIPLRDGTKLNATLYRPQGQVQALPCVFTLTPYIAQSYHDRAMYFAAHGYVFLTIDARGRGNSDGEFTPLLQEAHDGHDIVEWLAQQSYCNGKTSMWGGSYAGYNQWATAKEFPKHLTAIAPVASPMPGVDYPMRNNIFYPYDVQWLTLVSGRAAQDKLFADRKFWSAKYRQWFESHGAFGDIDRVVGNPSPIFQQWLEHPMQDAYWDSFNPTPEQFARIDLPILTITGQYDGDQPGAFGFYRAHMKYGSSSARDRHYLVIGPWDHAGTRTPQAKVGGLEFGPASVIDMNKLHREWYDYTLKDGAKPEFLRDRVAYYVAVADEWRYVESLEAVTAERRPFYLGSHEGRANDVFASGELFTGSPRKSAPDRFRADPLDTSAVEIEMAEDDASELTDQRGVLAGGAQFVYHSPPFATDTELAGFVSLSAWIALDQPDADLLAALYEIKPDGSSVLLSTDLLRARYRMSLRKAVAVQPGKIERYDFSNFTFAARLLKKGSRLRLVVAANNTMYLEKNYNAGGVVARETGKDARTVTVTLYHDAAHPSALYVPIGAAKKP